MQTPIISLMLAYIAGLLLGHGFLYLPFSISVLVILGALTAGILIRLDRLSFRRFLFALLTGLAGIAAYLYSAAWLPPDHYTRIFPADKTIHEMTGRIASPLDRDPDRTGFVMDLRTIDNTTVTGKIRVSVREGLSSVGYGDFIRVTSKLFEPREFNNPAGFDYPAYLAQSGISYTVSLKNAGAIEVLGRGSGMFRTIQDWRERIRRAFLASTTGPGSAILLAMVLGEEGGLTDEMRDQFMAAGVTHIISISGSHLGMVAVLCFGLIRGLLFLMPERWYHRMTLVTDPKKIAAWLTLPLVVFYTLLAGGQVATVRSLVMISAGLAALVLDREHALMHSLAVAALGILVTGPQAIFDISFQLSYLSVFVIGWAVTLWNDLQIKAETRLRKIRNSAFLLIIISLSTSLATGPLVAHYFNQISFAGILSNMIVVPFAGLVVVPLGLLSGVLSLFLDHLPLADLNQLVSNVFVSVVAFFSRLPFAEFHPPAPGVLWMALYALFLSSCAAYAGARLRYRFKPLEISSAVPKNLIIGIALSGVILIAPFALSFLPKKETAVSFPDVGQGDCALIELRSGKTVLIDGGGTRDNRFDIGRRVLAPYLWNRGVRKLDLVVLSHPHPDHMNGLLFVLKRFDVDEVWDSGLDRDLPGYDAFRQTIGEKKTVRRDVSADGPSVMLDDAEFRVLHPSRAFIAHDRRNYAAENDRSLVIKVLSEGKIFLFTGDIGTSAEKAVMRAWRDLKCDLLKVPHHGSRSSSSDAFVSLTRPEVAVVTVGRGNQYRHPSDEVIARYEKIGTRICRTDQDGAVTVHVKNGRLETTRWNELLMERVDLRDRDAWGKKERTNWGRLRIRATAF